MKALDTQFEDVKLAEVEDAGEHWEVKREDGWGFYIPKTDAVTPEPGDTARFYGKGIGGTVRGVDVNGVEVYYHDEAESRARAKLRQIEDDRGRINAWLENRAERDAKVAALPEPFRMRIARFRLNNPDFAWKNEPYEMSACVDAVKIAEACGDIDTFEEFRALDYAGQRERVPDLSDGHSGNTYGMAVRLAGHYLTKPDNVWMEHAAIAALIGCEEAGCLPVPPEKRQSLEAQYRAYSDALVAS